MEDFRLEIVELFERNAFLEREGALPANILAEGTIDAF